MWRIGPSYTLAVNDTDGNAVRYQACFCAENYIILFLGKSTKTAPTRAALFDSNIKQIVGLSPDPTGGAYSAPPDPLL